MFVLADAFNRMHDEVGQTLTAVALRAESAADLLERPPKLSAQPR